MEVIRLYDIASDETGGNGLVRSSFKYPSYVSKMIKSRKLILLGHVACIWRKEIRNSSGWKT